MLDMISVIVAFILAIIIYVVVAKKTHMWPFAAKPAQPATPAAQALALTQDSKMKSILLFVLILVLLLIAMIVANMVRRKSSMFSSYHLFDEDEY